MSFPIAAARAAGLEPLVVAKADTDLSGIDAPVLREPDQPSHPLLGIATALDGTGEPLVVCPCDLPLLEPDVLAHLASFPADPRPRLIVSARGPEPLLGVYPPETAPRLLAIAAAGGRSDEVLDPPGAELESLADAGGSERSVLNVNDRPSLEVAAEALPDHDH